MSLYQTPPNRKLVSLQHLEDQGGLVINPTYLLSLLTIQAGSLTISTGLDKSLDVFAKVLATRSCGAFRFGKENGQ